MPEGDPLCTAGPGIHVAECLDCHRVTDVGWAHLCEPCWDAHMDKVWREKLGDDYPLYFDGGRDG